MKFKFLPVLLFLSCTQTFAQQELTLFFSRNLVNSNVVNPANFTSESTVISFPSVAFNYGNSAFSYSDIFRKEGDKTIIDVDAMLGKLKDNNIIQTQLGLELLNIQFNVGKVNFSFMTAERLNFKFSYPKELIKLGWEGNAQYIGEEIEFGPAVRLSSYKEFAFGVAYNIGKFTVGHRLKLLSGRVNISTGNDQLIMRTGERIFESYLQTDYELNTSGINDLPDQKINPLADFSNPGLAMDFGVNFRPDENWTFSASLLDLGNIKWKEDIERFNSSGEFEFKGIELNNYFELDTFDIQEYGDSLVEQFEPDTSYDAYTDPLVSRLYLGASRKFKEKHEVGLLYYQEFLKGISPSFLLFYGYTLKKNTDLGVSYGFKNRRFNNIGLTASQRIKWFQIYFVSDNFLSPFAYRKVRNINFRVGFNFFIAKGNKVTNSSTSEE